MSLINKLLCWWKGHRRGRRIGKSAAAADFSEFRCPRCKATWTRKDRKA